MIFPSDSISVVDGASPSETTGCFSGSGGNKRSKSSHESHMKERPERTNSSTSRYQSAASEFDTRSSRTPESFLWLPNPPPNITPDGPSTPPKNRPGLFKRALSSSKTDSSLSTDAVTFKGKDYRASREASDGKVCLHTHHHHYWVVSGSVKLPQLRSSKERMPIQDADDNSRFNGTMESWPSEGSVEAMVEAVRPPSRNTNQRYLIEG